MKGSGSASVGRVQRSQQEADLQLLLVPFQFSSQELGLGAGGEGTGKCPLKGPGSLFHMKKRKYLSPEHPIKLTLLWLSLRWQLLRW